MSLAAFVFLSGASRVAVHKASSSSSGGVGGQLLLTPTLNSIDRVNELPVDVPSISRDAAWTGRTPPPPPPLPHREIGQPCAITPEQRFILRILSRLQVDTISSVKLSRGQKVGLGWLVGWSSNTVVMLRWWQHLTVLPLWKHRPCACVCRVRTFVSLWIIEKQRKTFKRKRTFGTEQPFVNVCPRSWMSITRYFVNEPVEVERLRMSV